MRRAFADFATSGALDAVIAQLSDAEITRLWHDWPLWARADQLPPEARSLAGDGGTDADHQATPQWRNWVILGGRGAGKTRAGAEWVRAQALGRGPFARQPAGRIALIGETLGDARAVMIEGVSGLLAIHPRDERPVFEPSRRQLTWPNGAIAQLFSAEDPDSLRGPQFAAAWCDELCKWRHAQAAWDMLQFGLRLGEAPRAVVTTTPRPVPLLQQLLADPQTTLTRCRTSDNRANLAESFLSGITARYAGSVLGRQELDGEIIDDRPDALWKRSWFEHNRVTEIPPLGRIVVGVDPCVTSGSASDACGIVAAGLGEDGIAYVLADRTVEGRAPLEWARAAIALFHALGADRIVAEVNQGGELVEAVIRQVDANVPVKPVRAMRGKWLRAEPVAALYAQGRVRHQGSLPELEDQMADFGPDGLSGGRSPDRLDALVWALTELVRLPGAAPRVRTI